MDKSILIFYFCVLAMCPTFSQERTTPPLLENLKVGFVSYRTGSAEVYLMNSDGSDVEQITSSSEDNSFPFQIDAVTIGFTRMDSSRNTTKHKINIHTKEESLLEEKTFVKGAKWEEPSPDKSFVAFIRSTDYSDRELFLYDRNTKEEIKLTSNIDEKHKALSINYKWSPDGRTLAIMSGPDWYSQYISLYRLGTDELVRLTERGYMNSGLLWLKDNKTLIANLKIRDETLYELYSIDVFSGNLKQLTTDKNLHPNISPDGKWIVFESQRHANDGEVYIMKPDGSSQYRLTSNPDYNGRCFWFSLH